MSRTISIIGFGNLGSHLYQMFVRSQLFSLVQVIRHRQADKALEKPHFVNWEQARETAVYCLAVPDGAIAETAKRIPQPHALVIHSSGALPLDAIPQQRRGVLYPLESFTKGLKMDYSRIPFFIEASDTQGLTFLKTLTAHIAREGQHLSGEQRLSLHLAAVLSNNFVNHLLYLSQRLLADTDVDFHKLAPIAQSTLQKAFARGPKLSQTGPAVRNDRETVKKHLDLIPPGKLRTLYEAMTQSIMKTHERKL